MGPGTVVQTHLFQDRVMSLDTVTIDAGATLAAHSVALPASVIGSTATVGPGSLVMRGDQVPRNSEWQGNPIEPWKNHNPQRGGGCFPPPPLFCLRALNLRAYSRRGD